MTKVSDTAYLETQGYFEGNFLDIDLDQILYKSIQIYESHTDKMDTSSSREAWKCFMKKSMAAYIQLLLNSSSKIKQKKSEEAVQKIQDDYDLFERGFSEYMSKKAMRPSLEVIGDVKNFFESSADFLSVSVEKMRNLHGPSFNSATVKALLNLRSDMTPKEKAVVFKECKDILSNFSNTDKGKTEGIFNNIDTKGGEAEFLAEMIAKKEGEGDSENTFIQEFKDDDVDDAFDVDAFMREGGIDLEDLDDKSDLLRSTLATKKVKNRDKVVEIKGRNNMKGYLFMQSSNADDSSQIFGKIFSTVTDTVNMVADTINKKRTKRYFAIKKNFLYIYNNEKANSADQDICIKDIEVLNHDEDSKKSFYFLYKRKVYRMEAKNVSECEEWIKSLELVMSKSEEFLNLDRYVDEKIFTKVSGKSLFRDYETILQEYRKKLWEEQEAKRKIEEEKKVEQERKRLEELGKKKAGKVAAKKSNDFNLELEKNKSSRPVPEHNLDSKLPRHQNTTHEKPNTFRTGEAQPPDTIKVGNPIKVEKVNSRPVNAVSSIQLESVPVEIVGPAQNDSDSDSPKGDKIPLLISKQSSDKNKNNKGGLFGINDSQKSENLVDHSNNETSEEIENLIRLDDQRKESMYDVMMKRESNSFDPYQLGKAKTAVNANKSATESGYEADRSRVGSRNSSAKNSMNTNKSTFTKPRTYIGEPSSQTSCFGSCWNWTLSLFRRH